MLGRAVSHRSRSTHSDVLPAITLDVTPTAAGLQLLARQLTTFAYEHELPEDVATRLVSVASAAADVLAGSVGSPPVGRLQADADIGRDDAQLVVIATDHRLIDRYAGLRERLERLDERCDGFATQLTPAAEVQVWARFALAP
jgi:hypothetical protein